MSCTVLKKHEYICSLYDFLDIDKVKITDIKR